MNKLTFIKKYWKIYLIIIIIVLGLYFTKRYIDPKETETPAKPTEKVLLFTISDTSKKCISNSLKVYNNNKYEIIKGAVPVGESNLIKTDTYNYDIDKLIASFNNDPCDMDTYFNYQVTLESGESYCISMTTNTELNKFLESLNEDNLFWCSR